MKSTKKSARKSWTNYVLGRLSHRKPKVGCKSSKRRQSRAETPNDAMLHNWLLEKDI